MRQIKFPAVSLILLCLFSIALRRRPCLGYPDYRSIKTAIRSFPLEAENDQQRGRLASLARRSIISAER